MHSNVNKKRQKWYEFVYFWVINEVRVVKIAYCTHMKNLIFYVNIRKDRLTWTSNWNMKLAHYLKWLLHILAQLYSMILRTNNNKQQGRKGMLCAAKKVIFNKPPNLKCLLQTKFTSWALFMYKSIQVVFSGIY